MKQTVIAIDIGNSALSYAVFEGRKVSRTGHIPLAQIPARLRVVTKKPSSNFIISSVVPKKTKEVRTFIKKQVPGARIYILGENLKINFPMRYDKSKLGTDRLVNLYGARQIYKTPFLVIDFGTAITFDYVSERGVFEGGLIVPGLQVSGEALLKQAALLPKHVELRPVKHFLGKNTESAFLSGLLNGFGFLADGLIGRFRLLSSKKLTVIATGGFAPLMARFIENFDRVDSLHTLKSLARIYYRKKEIGKK